LYALVPVALVLLHLPRNQCTTAYTWFLKKGVAIKEQYYSSAYKFYGSSF